MTQPQRVYHILFGMYHGNGHFTCQQAYDVCRPLFDEMYPTAKTPNNTVARYLSEFVTGGLLTRVDTGIYKF